jgi:ribonuclease R
MAAERDATDRYLTAFMSDRVGSEFAGRIAGVNKAGLFVRLNETGADGFIPAAHLPSEYWLYDENHAALVGDRSGKRYEMGMPVNVKLEEATPITGGLLFEMLSEPRPERKDLDKPSRSRRNEPRGRSHTRDNKRKVHKSRKRKERDAKFKANKKT